MIEKQLIDILICPKCKGNIRLSKKRDYIICDTCSLAYVIDNDIPLMLIDSAKKTDEIEEN